MTDETQDGRLITRVGRIDRLRSWSVGLLRKVLPVSVKVLPQRFRGQFHDWRLGIRTEGWLSVREAHRKRMAFQDGTPYKPVDWRLLREVSMHLHTTREDEVFDLGCGKGRAVIHFALNHHVRRVVGIEILPELARQAEENLSRVKTISPAGIICCDAANVDLTTATILFLYDPFGEKTLTAILEGLRRSLGVNPRPIQIVCVNQVHRHVYEGQAWLEKTQDINHRIWIWRGRDRFQLP